MTNPMKRPYKSPVAARNDAGVILEFESIAEAARHFQINYPHTISNCCRGLAHTAGGFTWWYLDRHPPSQC